MSQWYYAQNNQQFGPVTWEALQQMAMQRILQPYDLVWSEGMANWQAATTVPNLFAAAPVAGDQTAPYAAPGSPTAAGTIGYYTPTSNVTYAGFWLRFVAAIIDGVILFVIGMIIGGISGFLIGFVMGASGSAMQNIQLTVEIVAQIIGIIIGWLYEALLTSSSKQATLGKMALGIRVTGYDGQRISFARATGRHFAKFISAIIFMIGYIMAAFTERKQALHDLLASTLVVRG
jgi:uncharacterized RDD family membrane protein YckC